MPARSALTTGHDVRTACRSGDLTGQTSGLAPGYAQCQPGHRSQRARVRFPAVLPEEFPKPARCSMSPSRVRSAPRHAAPEADLRTDLPRYRIWKDGELSSEPAAVSDLWQDDFVSFRHRVLIHIRSGHAAGQACPCVTSNRITTSPCTGQTSPAAPPGVSPGPLVVSMRPMTPAQTVHAVQITSRYPSVHGAPIHIGEPAAIGVSHLERPDFGDPVEVRNGEVPRLLGVWCDAAIRFDAGPTAPRHHALPPGCMFVTDLTDRIAGRWLGHLRS